MSSDMTAPIKFHISQSVEGALKNWKTKDWKYIAELNNTSVKEVKKYFNDCKNEGKKVIPMNDCDNFSYEHGCLGHIMKEV